LDAQLAARGHHVSFVDPLEYRLPLLDKMYKEYPAGAAPDPLPELADIIRAALERDARGDVGIREATDCLKTELRRQITSACLGNQLANTWRGEVYPKVQPSIAAAGYVGRRRQGWCACTRRRR
jgi:hypothetical protein